MSNLKTWCEAQGVDYDNHKEKYGELVDAIGLKNLIPYIPARKESIAAALANGDEHLNTIPLKKWGDMDKAVRSLVAPVIGERVNYKTVQFTWSLSESVCLLKAAARKWSEE